MRASWLMMLSVLAGCPDRTVSGVPSTQGSVEVKDFPAIPRRNLDILFLIDNSRSMKEEQDSLKANFGRFISVLESAQGGLPNVHIGVTTSDLGTSASDGMNSGSRFGCANGGDGGTLRPLASGDRWIVDEDDGHGGRTRNYTGALADAFTEIADVGTLGCGIEQHLGAIDRALDPGNAVNHGFVRDDAYLAIIIIADEDDCSLAHTGLFDGTDSGEVVNFRCTEDGVACDSPATDFLMATGPRTGCHPKATPRWVEQPEHFAEMIKGLKASPKDVIVAGIIGTTDKFGITTSAAGATVLDSSCSYNKPNSTEKQVAFPAVRTAAFLEAFPARFTQQSICEPDLSPALLEVSKLIAETLGTRCFEQKPADLDPDTDGAQYSCSVVEVRRIVNQPDEELVVVPPCPGDGTAGGACWQIVADNADCAMIPGNPQQLALDIEWNGAPHDETIHIEANCVTESADGGGPFQ
jgi:hypothetical protein